MAFVRSTMRLFVLVGALSSGALPASSGPKPQPNEATTATFNEVRLRKLHLVRPDLIPYPVRYDVLC